MNKKQLREIYLNKRQHLTDQEINKLNDLLLIKFQSLSFEALDIAHTYVPAPAKKEFDTIYVLDYLQFMFPELQIAVPRIIPGTFEMQHILTDELTSYVPNKWGIPEPEGNDFVDPKDIDLILIPLLCFDKQGYRVGYGKGYYDRFLKNCNPYAIKMGFSWFPPVDHIEDAADFDVPLNFCITVDNIYEF